MNDVKKFFIDAFRHLGNTRTVPEIEVRFYPYAGLNHTIRLRQVALCSLSISQSLSSDVVRSLRSCFRSCWAKESRKYTTRDQDSSLHLK